MWHAKGQKWSKFFSDLTFMKHHLPHHEMTQVNVLCHNSSQADRSIPVLDLLNLEGWKVELTRVVGHIPRGFAQRRSLI